MLSRRAFCACFTIPAVTAITSTEALTAACEVITPQAQRSISPSAAIARLKAGNERFVSGHTINCDRLQQAKAAAGGQAPYAVVISCIDSRAAPELVFDQGFGDIFSARIAGNFVNRDIVGSVEFATAVVGASAVVVVGHSNCGAIKGAIDNVRSGELTATLANIRPVLKTVKYDGLRNSSNAAFVAAVAEANARHAAARLLRGSKALRKRVEDGKLRVDAAIQDLETGKVAFLDAAYG